MFPKQKPRAAQGASASTAARSAANTTVPVAPSTTNRDYTTELQTSMQVTHGTFPVISAMQALPKTGQIGHLQMLVFAAPFKPPICNAHYSEWS